jgi:hypothetical protein
MAGKTQTTPLILLLIRARGEQHRQNEQADGQQNYNDHRPHHTINLLRIWAACITGPPISGNYLPPPARAEILSLVTVHPADGETPRSSRSNIPPGPVS